MNYWGKVLKTQISECNLLTLHASGLSPIRSSLSVQAALGSSAAQLTGEMCLPRALSRRTAIRFVVFKDIIK